MKIVIDMTGQKIGLLTVVEPLQLKPKKIHWKCICDCGNISYVSTDCLRRKNPISACIKCANKINGDKRQYNGYGEVTSWFFTTIKGAARARNIECSLTLEYIGKLYLEQNKKCALTGLDIQFAKKRRKRELQTASLDRIDSSKGYIEGNVQWVHKDVNFMKQDYTISRFIEICELVTRTNNGKRHS